MRDVSPAVKPITTVRVPRAEAGATAGSRGCAARPGGRLLTARRWEDAPYLAARLASSAGLVKKLQPHTPEAGSLALAGSSAEAVAWAACQAPVALGDVEALLAVRQPGLFEEYAAAKAAAQEAATTEAAAAAERAARTAARAAAAGGTLARPGPHLTFSSDQLVMTGVEGDGAASAVLTVTSTGTAAVYFTWSREGGDCGAAAPGGAPGSGEAAGGGGGGSEAGDEGSSQAGADSEAGVESEAGQQSEQQQAPAQSPQPAAPARFYQPQRSGVILPGEAREFVFTFRSAAAGVYSEAWALATTPLLPSLGLRHRAGQPVRVALRGVAVPRELGQAEVARRALEAGLQRRERDRQVRRRGPGGGTVHGQQQPPRMNVRWAAATCI